MSVLACEEGEQQGQLASPEGCSSVLHMLDVSHVCQNPLARCLNAYEGLGLRAAFIYH